MKHANVLSLKYRPQYFADVVGQEVACRILSKTSITDSVAPAYILSGTRGVGKTTLARIFAKALLCKHAPVGEPCNECSHCVRIGKGQFVDVIELDAASHRSIDDIRDLRENIGFSPMEGRYKIFILDEAHMLTKEAYNALLKTLEEPPPFVVFIFASTDIQKFPATIISRCQHIVLKSVALPVLVEHISSILDKEGIQYTEEAVECIARRGFGSVRDSLSVLGQVLHGIKDILSKDIVEEMLGLATQDIYLRIMNAMSTGNTLEVVQISQMVLEKGIDIKYFLQELTALCRTLFLTKQHGEKAFPVLNIPKEQQKELIECVQEFSLEHIHICWQMVLYGQKQVLESVEPSIALELLLLNIVSVRGMISIENKVLHSSVMNESNKTGIENQASKNQENIKKVSSILGVKDGQRQPSSAEKKSINNEEEKRWNRGESVEVSAESKKRDGITNREKNVGFENRINIKQEDGSARELDRAKEKEGKYSSNEVLDEKKDRDDSITTNKNGREEDRSTISNNKAGVVEGREGPMKRKGIVTKEYENKSQYPILDVIEEEFNTTYTYIPKRMK